MSARDFIDDLGDFEAEVIAPDPSRNPAQSRRDFAAGYLAAVRNAAPRDQLHAQVLAYARSMLGRDSKAGG